MILFMMTSPRIDYEQNDFDYRLTNNLDIDANEKRSDLKRYEIARKLVKKCREEAPHISQEEEELQFSTDSEANVSDDVFWPDENSTRIYRDSKTSKLYSESSVTTGKVQEESSLSRASTRIFRDQETGEISQSTTESFSVDTLTKNQIEITNRYHQALKLSTVPASPVRIFRDPKTSELSTSFSSHEESSKNHSNAAKSKTQNKKTFEASIDYADECSEESSSPPPSPPPRKDSLTKVTKINVTKRKTPNTKPFPVIAYHCDIKNHVKVEYLLLQKVTNIQSGCRIKTFTVLNQFNPKTSRSIRCFYHFKCMICQIELYGSESLIYHAKRRSHQRRREKFMLADSEKLKFVTRTLEKLHETEKELAGQKEYLMKLTAQLASRRSHFKSLISRGLPREH